MHLLNLPFHTVCTLHKLISYIGLIFIWLNTVISTVSRRSNAFTSWQPRHCAHASVIIQCTAQIIPGFTKPVFVSKVYVNKGEWKIMDNWTKRHPQDETSRASLGRTGQDKVRIFPRIHIILLNAATTIFDQDFRQEGEICRFYSTSRWFSKCNFDNKNKYKVKDCSAYMHDWWHKV